MDTYMLEIRWDEGVSLPSRVGPFDTADEARKWGTLNVPNGTWETVPLAYPYMRSGERDVYVVETPQGFTETFDAERVETLLRLGLIRHDRDGYVLEDGHGNGVGALHHFYVNAVTQDPTP